MISGWGSGVNTTEPIELALDLGETTATMSLSATQYTLLQHEHALQRMMPKAAEQGAGIVVGAPFNSGALLGGEHFDYAEIPALSAQKIKALRAVAARHGVSLKAAALQFSTAHPAITAVIPGSSRPERITEDLQVLKEEIPAAFWAELRQKQLNSALAPLPQH